MLTWSVRLALGSWAVFGVALLFLTWGGGLLAPVCWIVAMVISLQPRSPIVLFASLVLGGLATAFMALALVSALEWSGGGHLIAPGFVLLAFASLISATSLLTLVAQNREPATPDGSVEVVTPNS